MGKIYISIWKLTTIQKTYIRILFPTKTIEAYPVYYYTADVISD